MLTYNMDVTPESVWKRTTPSEAELAQPYYCTEAGVFYAQQHFSTALLLHRGGSVLRPAAFFHRPDR